MRRLAPLLQIFLLLCIALLLFTWKFVNAMFGCAMEIPPTNPLKPPVVAKPIVHKIWYSDDLIPIDYIKSQARCQHLSPDYSFIVWNTTSIESHIRSFHPEMMDVFNSYRHDIQRIDSSRYMILHDLGGVYMDMDIECKKPIGHFIRALTHNESDRDAVILVRTGKLGLTNCLIVAQYANNNFFSYMISRLKCTNQRYLTHHWTVMFSAGSTFLWRSYALYSSLLSTVGKAISNFHLASSEDFNEYFTHHRRSSWHGWDEPYILWFEQHLFIIPMSVVVIAAYLVLGFRRRNRML